MSTQPTLTHNAWPFLVPWSGTQWAQACCDRYETVSYVRGNRFTAVAKDSTKMRGIAIEPSLNVFYQLGVGQNLKSCLKRAGLDLVHAQPKHKQAACAASIDGRFATIDLSNASDTLSWSLVKLLLPRAWFEKLDALRSPYTNVDGKWVLLEKFSSMGNGYTFELETVVFLALACAWMEGQYIHPVVGKNVLVFGDDIIIPTCADPEGFKSFLRFFGFAANPNKTFIEGPFRESCGGDYWDGRDVRPFHLKEFPNEPQGWIVLANGLRKLSVMDRCDVHSDHYTYRAWLRVLDAIPSLIRKCRGPEELGDLCIADDKKWWTTRSRGGIRYLRVWRGRAVKPLLWHHWTPNIVLATAVYSDLGHRVGRGGSVGIIPRDPLMSYKLGWVPYS